MAGVLFLTQSRPATPTNAAKWLLGMGPIFFLIGLGLAVWDGWTQHSTTAYGVGAWILAVAIALFGLGCLIVGAMLYLRFRESRATVSRAP